MPQRNSLAPPDRPAAGAVRIGRFLLVPEQLALFEGTTPIRLGSRALRILIALVEHAGEAMSKAELVAQVWPGIAVEDGALRVHMSALRRALGNGRDGERYVVTVPGHGYRFVGPVARVSEAAGPPPAAAPHPSLPLPLSRVVGRDGVVRTVAAELSRHGFVTIVGPGGIGKTTVAIAVAGRAAQHYPDGIHLVDLAVIPPSDSVAAAVALAMGCGILSEDRMPGLVASLRARRALLVLDSCERLAPEAALLVERLRLAVPGVHVLATSREALRADGERVVSLPPLDLPPPSRRHSVAGVMESSAVQLFVERATAASDDFVLRERDAPVVAEICTRLDGVALAIELAAAQVAAFDLQGIARLLEDRFRLLARGRRTARRRHQTMAAALDWSFDSLPAREQRVLCRLSVFEGAIALGAAQTVLADEALAPAEILESIPNLVDRSLLSAEITEDGVFYRLLDTTRAYAAARLREREQPASLARRHAAEQLQARRRADAAWSSRSNREWLLAYRREVGNLRVALDWAFSDQGDAALGVTLAAAALPMLFELSLADECRRRASLALAAAAASPAPDPWEQMRLGAVLAAAQMYTPGPSAETIATWDRVVELAVRQGDRPSHSRALWGLWTGYLYGGRPGMALSYARRLHVLAGEMRDEARLLMAERIIGISLHYLGRQAPAAEHLGRMIGRYDPARHRFRTLGFPTDHGVLATATLARTLWVRGLPDQAVAASRRVLDAALDQDYAVSSGFVLLESAFPIAFLTGDLDGAARALERLAELAAQGGVAIWQAAERCARLALRMARGAPATLDDVQTALAGMRATGLRTHETWLCGIMAEALGRAGHVDDGLSLVDEALATCARSGEGWCVAELHRVRGEVLARRGAPGDGDAASAALRTALDVAQRQGASSFALRAAIGLVRVADAPAARAELAAILAGFQEGFGTADLLQARQLLSDG